MITHQSGAIYGNRKGSELAVHTFPVFFSDPSGTAKQLGTFHVDQITNDGTPLEPIVLECEIICDTQDNSATSATLAVGFTSAAFGDFFATYNMKTAVAKSVTPGTVAQKLYFTGDVTIFALPTRVGAPTAGLFYVKISAYGVNINAIDNQNSDGLP